MERRNFLKAAVAAPLAGLIPESKVPNNRPPIQGELGKTYFYVGAPLSMSFRRVFPDKHLYIDGKDVFTVAFEADLIGQWIGVYRHRWEGIPLVSGEQSQILWIHGHVEIK